MRHLYVEQRELAEPVTLYYPTFAAAAEGGRNSRIWAGVHWPADNERGLKLGRKVGESVWRRAEQFVLGTASPAAAAFAALRPPFWFHDNKRRITPPILKRLRASQSTCRLRELACGGASGSMRCPRAHTS